MKTATIIAFCLVVIGSLVWFIIGIANFNVVAWLFGAGEGAVVSRIVYSLVGISALWLVFYYAIYNPSRQMQR